MERRLTAVLVADMVGFSRLMENNESDIIDRPNSHRRELIDLEIERHRGNIIKTTGDGLLAEFGSVKDAVRSAIVIQNGMSHRERNSAYKVCIASDDTQIAYVRLGRGLPILKAPNWLGHLEYE